MRMMHLNKSGSGMASKTTCGRNVMRTPMSTSWEDFKKEPVEHRCAKCEASKQAEVNRRMDAQKEESIVTVSEHVPPKSVEAIRKLAEKVAAKYNK